MWRRTDLDVAGLGAAVPALVRLVTVLALEARPAAAGAAAFGATTSSEGEEAVPLLRRTTAPALEGRGTGVGEEIQALETSAVLEPLAIAPMKAPELCGCAFLATRLGIDRVA